MSRNRQVSISRWAHTGLLAAVGVVSVGFSFSAVAAGGPSLGAARSFAALGGSTVASTGLSAITGDVGVSPGTAITGFPPGTVTGGSIHAGDAAAAAAHADAALAYDFLAGMPSIPANNLTGTDLGGLTLAPGVYTFNTSAQLTGTLTLDAQGDSGALFVIQIGTTLTTASNAAVNVINGGADYDESNVFWQVGTSATLGSGTAFRGNVLAYSSITLVAGSSMTGDALALNGAVSIDGNSITSPTLVGVAPPTAPLGLKAVVVAGLAVDLMWTDTSGDETEFRVFRRTGAGPAFTQVGTIASPNTPGTGGTVSFHDATLAPATTYTYRVTAFSNSGGQSVASNESLVQTGGAADPARWLDIHLGRAPSVIRELTRARADSVLVTGSYAVIDVNTSVPTVVHDADPSIAGVTIAVRAPGNLVLLQIPAHDPTWKVSKRGVYVWRSHGDSNAPRSSLRIDTRRSEFTFKSARNDFASVPANSITVSMTFLAATGSEVRAWVQPAKLPAGTRAVFKLSQ